MVVGHSHPAVVEAVQEAASRALSFGAPTEAEIELAELVCRLVPSVEMVRLVSSGTEATMTAVRLARGFTGRSLIVKFEGCYHGHADSLLVKAGSGALTFGNPSSAGVPADTAAHTVVLEYNDLSQLGGLFDREGANIAGVIVEPVAGNMNLVLPAPGFLEKLREQCTRHGAVLILDEVMTGFRVALGGAQARFGIRPDLTTLGKVIGGGLPVGAVGGRREIMEKIAPLGPVYQAGTLSGNPLATAAGLAVLSQLDADAYADLTTHATRFADGLRDAFTAASVKAQVTRVGTLTGLFFADTPVTCFSDAQAADHARYARFFHGMLAGSVPERKGGPASIFLPPSGYEAMFVSLAHTDAEIEQIIAAARAALSD